ncbi:hypothetical protein AB0903_09085 [Streptomyces sp. NPDC048389]|uniref:hypothetical protein n=1 Tax=Streptomyces sp. NPDC048389 TaxID=3154622 RepID=UPI003454EE08
MDRWDVLALLGIGLLGTGLGLVELWLGIAVAGLALLTIGVSGALIEERTAVPEPETPNGGG